jgi:hypothetical protein
MKSSDIELTLINVLLIGILVFFLVMPVSRSSYYGYDVNPYYMRDWYYGPGDGYWGYWMGRGDRWYWGRDRDHHHNRDRDMGSMGNVYIVNGNMGGRGGGHPDKVSHGSIATGAGQVSVEGVHGVSGSVNAGVSGGERGSRGGGSEGGHGGRENMTDYDSKGDQGPGPIADNSLQGAKPNQDIFNKSVLATSQKVFAEESFHSIPDMNHDMRPVLDQPRRDEMSGQFIDASKLADMKETVIQPHGSRVVTGGLFEPQLGQYNSEH